MAAHHYAGSMALVETRDRMALSAFFRRDPALHAYALGDLDDFFWPHTRWWVWDRGQGFEQVALLYTEPEVPVLLLLEAGPEGAATSFALELIALLPERIYMHISPSLLRQFEAAFRTTIEPVPHLKLGHQNLRALAAPDDPRVSHLTPADLVEVEAFYAGAYPGTWFEPRMLETNRYLGIREDGRLLCVAGLHVYSPAYRVAALGNVATAPAARGRGLARALCARLCVVLRDQDGIETVALNVAADNAPALAVYRGLGFVEAGRYVEVGLERG